MLAKYFNGIAIKRSIKKEIPSAKAMYRNVFSVFIFLDFRFWMLDKSLFQIECFKQQTTNNKPFELIELIEPLKRF